MRTNRTTRDAGLRQVSTATKWIAGTAAVLTGFLTVWEARSVHDANATPTVVQQPSASSSGSSPSATDPGYSDPGYSDPGYSDPGYSGGIQAPDVAPTPSDRQPAASSGGS